MKGSSERSPKSALVSAEGVLPLQSEERWRPRTRSTCRNTSPIGFNWLSLPVPSYSNESPIPPGQKPISPSNVPMSVSWKVQQKSPEDYEKDRMGKYAEYFKGNEILPIPEIVKKIEPRILSLVVSDLKTSRLTGLKKETFEELLRTAGIQYFCRRSFATWDDLLPTEEQAAKTAAININKVFPVATGIYGYPENTGNNLQCSCVHYRRSFGILPQCLRTR